MKNKIVKSIVFATIATLIIACNPKKEEPVTAVVDNAQVKKEIQAMEDAFAAAYNSRNMESLEYYDKDAITYSQNAPALVGKTAIDNSIRQDIAAFPKGFKLANTTNEVHVSSDGNQVVEIGAYRIVDSTNTLQRSGNYISVFKKIGSKYYCQRDMAASNMKKDEKK